MSALLHSSSACIALSSLMSALTLDSDVNGGGASSTSFMTSSAPLPPSSHGPSFFFAFFFAGAVFFLGLSGDPEGSCRLVVEHGFLQLGHLLGDDLLRAALTHSMQNHVWQHGVRAGSSSRSPHSEHSLATGGNGTGLTSMEAPPAPPAPYEPPRRVLVCAAPTVGLTSGLTSRPCCPCPSCVCCCAPPEPPEPPERRPPPPVCSRATKSFEVSVPPLQSRRRGKR
mmetsp:Transcript_9186/g.28549  ORF Transcript_9186/g.28549 Transcript_9186/m.28549 type:complete len:226 (-) Transcript_9186:1224-1901(-)